MQAEARAITLIIAILSQESRLTEEGAQSRGRGFNRGCGTNRGFNRGRDRVDGAPRAGLR